MGKARRVDGVLRYPKHRFRPEDLLNFIEAKAFSQEWSQLKLSDDDLGALQVSIMSAPEGPPVIVGTGGLRKLRFAPLKWSEGKRDALRVCYAYFPESHIVWLGVVNAASASCLSVTLTV